MSLESKVDDLVNEASKASFLEAITIVMEHSCDQNAPDKSHAKWAETICNRIILDLNDKRIHYCK